MKICRCNGEKGEYTRAKHFVLFQQCFKKNHFLWVLKFQDCEVNSLIYIPYLICTSGDLDCETSFQRPIDPRCETFS